MNLQAKQREKVERMREIERMKEYMRPREDLTCDDLKVSMFKSVCFC